MDKVLQSDVDAGYLDESLHDALRAGHSGRHIARMAHLSISRGISKHRDEATHENMDVIIAKVFGDFSNNEDVGGWMWRTSFGKNVPRRGGYVVGLRRGLQATFDTKTLSRRELTAYRVVHLLMPEETGNMFAFFFSDGLRGYRRFHEFPVSKLPPFSRDAANDWFARASGRGGGSAPSAGSRSSTNMNALMQRSSPLPALYKNLVAASTPLVGVAVKPNTIPLTLPELYIFRFVHWFVSENFTLGEAPRAPQAPPSKAGGRPTPRPPSFSLHGLHLDDISAASPAMELLRMYCAAFLPPSLGSDGVYDGRLNGRVTPPNAHYSSPSFPRTLSSSSSSSSPWGSLFLLAASDFWLEQHRKPPMLPSAAARTGSSGLPPAGAGSASISRLRRHGSVAQPQTSSAGALLNPMQLGAIAILVSHLQSEMAARVASGVELEQLQRAAATRAHHKLASTLGTTPNLRCLDTSFYNFAIKQAETASQTANYSASCLEANLLGVLSTWICFLEPWKACERVSEQICGFDLC